MPSVKRKETSPEGLGLDFATVLAASVHDMKNSLFLLQQAIEQVAEEVEKPQPRRRLADIHYETQRLNTGLMQLLSLFRHDQQALPINREEHFLDELGDDIVAANQFYAQHHNVELSFEAADDASWFFDQNLIVMLLNDVVINALRYAKTQVMVHLGIDAITDEMVVEVHDDGQGYPQSMIDSLRAGPGAMELRSGRTGLGLYFSHLIAEAHQAGKRAGSITLSNDSKLGGSLFTLRLP
ncbi:MAG: HAMP domain-containing histidine kinase [Idiomarina sp.]|nr:HAMP domain-containing histidine kinase [Idiomarina sp.]